MELSIKGFWLRIAGQAIAFLSLLFLLFDVMGVGVPDIIKEDKTELLIFLPFFAFTSIGYVLAYFFPVRGGTMLIIGGTLMMCCHLIFSNFLTALVFGLPFIVAGALILVATRKPKS